MITKDNIAEVLKHNGIDLDVRIGVSFSETFSIHIRHESISRDIFSCDLYCNWNWLAALESFLGKKLEPLPFNFEQALLDGGFTSHFDGDPQLTDNKYYKFNEHICINYDAILNKFYFFGTEIKPTSANAERLIKAAAMLNELELAK